MEDLVITIAIVAGIINLIILIAFFQLAGNVSQIRKSIAKDDRSLLSEYEKHLAFGDKELAYEALKEAIWMQYRYIVADKKPGKYPAYTIKHLETLRKKHEPQFLELGHQYPDFK